MVNNVRSNLIRYTPSTAGAATEDLWIAGPVETWASSGPANPPLLMYVHGASQFGPASLLSPFGLNTYKMLYRLAEKFTVCFSDLGSMSVGDRWGGPDHLLRIDDLYEYMDLTFFGNAGTGLSLVGESMGSLGALNYARNFPSHIRSVAAMIPVTDLDDFRTAQSASAVIDPCYPPSGYVEATMGANYNPVTCAPLIDAGLPVKLYYSTYDHIIPVSYITDYVAARPQTQTMDCSFAADATDPPAYGHSDNTIGVGLADVLSFCNSFI